MSDIKQILENIGYKLVRDGTRYWRAKPIYRDSGNNSSLRISSKSGWFTDYSANLNGPFVDLIKLSLGLKSVDDAKSWLARNEFEVSSFQAEEEPIIENAPKYYNEEMLDKLIRNHDYWNGRGVSNQVLERYRGGVALSGAMYGRYVIPIFNEAERLVGFAGRDITGKSPIKWKLIGQKYEWIFPSFNIGKIRDNKEVILVESVGDHLALEEAGIYTSIVLFGVHLSDIILSKLNGLMLNKIIVALNNDKDNGNVGENAAKDVQARLLQFFDPNKVKIKIPTGYNDFGEMPAEEIRKWYNS